MKNRAPLALIEQAAMLLVFALAAALCLRAFAWADSQSRELVARDQALIQAQNAAETLKHQKGDLEAAAQLLGGVCEDGAWTICYDGDWRQVQGAAAYWLVVTPAESGLDYLGMASVEVLSGEDQLVQINVCWQEVTADG